MARAVYKRSNIYLLDDPLAALDNHVRVFIFNHCILNFLAERICIMVSQNTQHIEKANSVIFLSEGNIKYDENTMNLQQCTTIMPNDIIETIVDKNHEANSKTSMVLETEQQQSLRSVYHEVKKGGKVHLDIYKKYCQYGGGNISMITIFFLFATAQICDSYTEKLLTTW